MVNFPPTQVPVLCRNNRCFKVQCCLFISTRLIIYGTNSGSVLSRSFSKLSSLFRLDRPLYNSNITALLRFISRNRIGWAVHQVVGILENTINLSFLFPTNIQLFVQRWSFSCIGFLCSIIILPTTQRKTFDYHPNDFTSTHHWSWHAMDWH